MTFATREMAPALSALWQECFGDEEAYVDLFLEHLFRPGQTLVALEGSEPVAMLSLLPVTLCHGGVSYRGRYVYAVATARAHRGRGLSTALLREAAQVTRGWREDFTLLVPAGESLFGFYGQRGYRTAFYQSHVEIPPQAVEAAPPLDIAPGRLADQGQLREKYFCGRGPFAGWGEEMLRYIQREQVFTGGGVVTFPGGYGVYGVFEDELIIKELVSAQTPPAQAAAALARQLGFRRAVVRLAPTGGGDTPYAMLHWCGDRPAPELGDAPGYFGLGLD